MFRTIIPLVAVALSACDAPTNMPPSEDMAIATVDLAPSAPRFNGVYDYVFGTGGCASRGCHDDSGAGYLSLTDPDTAYSALVGVPPAQACLATLRVDPGHPENSELWRKVAPDVAVCGAKMPKNGTLAPELVTMVYQWIESGAAR